MNVKFEKTQFVSHNQMNLRCEDYANLKKVMTRTNTMLPDLLNIIVLSSTFTIVFRYMQELTQDAKMTYVRHFCRLDLFINFKCNRKWPEILVLFKQD